jgi:hypothetical protein
MIATYDIREGKESPMRPAKYTIARCGDEIMFERGREGYLLGVKRYDGRVGDAVDWWAISAKNSPRNFYRVRSYRAYWG